MRKDLQEEAKEKCKDLIGTFAMCAQEQGLWVVFNCRSKMRAVNECLATHNSEEAWQKYKEEHKEELAIRSMGLKVKKPETP